jgi:hypothetical protein
LTDLKLAEVRPVWRFLASDLNQRQEAEFSSDWHFVMEKQLEDQRAFSALQPRLPDAPYTMTYEAIDAREWPLARVALASAACPPFIGPISFDAHWRRSYANGRSSTHPENLALSDGGVLSNLGLPARTISFSQILVSDASYPPNLTAPSGVLKLWTRRALSAAMSTYDTRWIDRNRFIGGPPVIRWSTKQADARVGGWRISRVRTDLDRFTEPETKLLENAGYLAASIELAKLEGFEDSLADARAPHPDWLDEGRAAWALSGSSHRFVKVRVLRRPWDRYVDKLAKGWSFAEYLWRTRR